MTLLFLTGGYAYNTFLAFTPYKMVYHIVNGDFGSVIEKEEEAIREIKESSEKDVVIYMEQDRDGLWVNFARSRFIPLQLSIRIDKGAVPYQRGAEIIR